MLSENAIDKEVRKHHTFEETFDLLFYELALQAFLECVQ